MFNRYGYNQSQYNQDGIHSGKWIKTRYVTSDIPRDILKSEIPEIVMISDSLINFDIDIKTVDQMKKDFRDIEKDFE